MKHLISLLFLGFSFSTYAQTLGNLMVIAHRGGVVNDTLAENSLNALEEAIRRGYTHVEVDARISADGYVVCFHNDDLKEETGQKGRISQMKLAEIKQIKLLRSGEFIPTFDEYCSRLAGRIGIMVDIKGCNADKVEQYANQILASLSKYGLLEDALILINKTPIHNQEKIISFFMGKAKVSWRNNFKKTQSIAEKDPDFAKKYYVFNHGADFDQEEINGFQSLGLKVIVSVNTGHYRNKALQKGKTHIRKVLKYETDGVQIDAVYDGEIWKK